MIFGVTRSSHCEQEQKSSLHSSQKPWSHCRSLEKPAVPDGSAASGSEGPGARGVFALVSRLRRTHFLLWSQDLSGATLDEYEKTPVVEKSPHSPGHRSLWSGMRVPTPQGDRVPGSKSGSPEPFTRGFHRSVGVFPGIRPKQRHYKMRRIRNQLRGVRSLPV